MPETNIFLDSKLSRRTLIGMSGCAVGAAGLLSAAGALGLAPSAAFGADAGAGGSAPDQHTKEIIERIVEAEGKVANGVLSIDIERKDIKDVKLHGTPISPTFQINGTLTFEQHGGDVMMNSDFALRPEELNPFIETLIAHDIVFQAEHQHMYDYDPMVWFIHFRAFGPAETVARGVKAAMSKTSAPFPQSSPKNPKSPLPAEAMGHIIGAKPSISSRGVVHFGVPRAEPITLGGRRISRHLNVESPVSFQPLGDGSTAAAVPDFGMIASEVNPVVGLMRRQGWDIGCLYNQETDESPQLYFSHMFKTGNPLDLAREIRRGFDLMNVRRA